MIAPLKTTLQILFLLISVHTIGQVNDPSNAKHKFETEIDKIFAGYNDLSKPGAAVSVVQDGKIVFKKGYGSANLEYDLPVSPSTVFHIASVSKQFTVFSILLLEKEGKLSFDDDIRKHIPEMPDFNTPITLRHLAAHTSGLRDQWDLLNLAGWRWDDVITKEHIFKLVFKQKELNFEPGEQYMYCNTGFTLLAEVVARVSGKSFAEFTQERIFEPLNMSNTLFYDDHEKIVKNRSYSYHMGNAGYKKSVLSFANVGATSLFTTVEDLALWAIKFNSTDDKDLDIINKMNTEAKLNNRKSFGGAYGQFVNTYKGLHQIQHGGSDAGYRSYLGRFPEQNFAVMVFSNYANANPNNLALQVADVFLENKMEETTAAAKNTSKPFVQLSTDQLEKWNGHYWNEAGTYSRKIYVKSDTLRYFRGEGNESNLVPVSKSAFKMLDVPSHLIVKFKGKDGKKSMIVTIDDGDPITSDQYTPPNYTVSGLQEFIGKYYSPELSTTYSFVIDGDQLLAKHARVSDFKIDPVKTDFFSTGGSFITFQRDGDDKIIGLKTSTGRVRNLWFEKRE